jgi:hypothetical protein
MPLVASVRSEGSITARAQTARRKRAHAFWREIGRRPRDTAAHAATTYRAVGIDGIPPPQPFLFPDKEIPRHNESSWLARARDRGEQIRRQRGT